MKLALVLFVSYLGLVAAATATREANTLTRTDNLRAQVWHMQRVMGVPLTPSSDSDKRSISRDYRHWVMRLWQRRLQEVRAAFEDVPYRAAWECIHRYEGSWTDPAAPYYGGLQMDASFQQSYGPYLYASKGTADNWTPTEQMWVATKAMRSGRGFYPWPNTAKACGLI